MYSVVPGHTLVLLMAMAPTPCDLSPEYPRVPSGREARHIPARRRNVSGQGLRRF